MQNYMKTILSAVKFYIDKIAAKIPTKTSQLENDLNFATEGYINNTISNSIEENDNNLIVKYNENRLKLLFDEESYEILNGKISDLATYEYMVSASDVKNRPAFLFNIEKNLSDYNNFDYYFVQVKLPIDGKNYYSNGYAKFNKGARVTFMQPFGGYDYIQLMTIQKVEKIYENADSNSLIDAHGKCCVRVEPYHYYSTVEEAEVLAEIIRNAEITIYCGRLNNLALDNTVEYVPTGDYNPATKKYVDEVKAYTDAEVAKNTQNIRQLSDTVNDIKNDIGEAETLLSAI